VLLLGMDSSIMSQLDNVWRQQRLSLSTSTKLRIYSLLVQLVALYGSETWTMRKVDSDKIQSFHTQARSRILNIKWYDKVSNAAVRQQPDLPSLIADRRHSLFGHVCRPITHLPRSHCNCQLMLTLAFLSCRLETTTGSSKENVAATSRRGLRDICWSRSDHKPRSLLVEIATTLSWSSAAVSV